MEREIMNLPVVALRGLVILPEMVKHFDVSRKKSLQAIEHAMVEGQKIFLTAQKDVEIEDGTKNLCNRCIFWKPTKLFSTLASIV